MPPALYEAVVPMTSVLNPSPWYSALVSYKGFQRRNGAILASLTYHFLDTHAASIERLLGGLPSMITIVPSKRVPFKDQPLGIAIGWAEPIRRQLRQTLIYDTSKPVHRKDYSPSAFQPAKVRLTGERIVLIEDTWVTGATAMSAAGALLEHGAKSVGVFPVARVLNDHYWPEDHPYRAAMRQRFDESDPFIWPR